MFLSVHSLGFSMQAGAPTGAVCACFAPGASSRLPRVPVWNSSNGRTNLDQWSKIYHIFLFSLHLVLANSLQGLRLKK